MSGPDLSGVGWPGASAPPPPAAPPGSTAYVPPPLPPALRTAHRMPSWFGSIRVRLTFVYSSVLFFVATFLVGLIYMAESRALNSMTYDQSSIYVLGGQVRLYTTEEFAQRVHGVALDYLRQYSLVAVVVLFLLSLIIGWVVSGGVLRPIERITGVAKEIQATDLSRRINLGGPNDELRELADTFDAMLGRIDEAFESQRQFIHEASHELRNPLAVIRTNLDVMLADPDSTVEDLRHTLEVVQRSSERMGRLVDDLLVYARNGQLSVRREQVDVHDLVVESAEEFATSAESKGIRLASESAPDLWVDGDRHALRQALANLLANAVRLSPSGTTINVRAGAQGPWVWMSVEDEGPGIAPQDQARVFQRFWKGERGNGRGEVRSGLGLTIVRQVAQAHGGEVKLVSEPGRGSAFAVWLPAATVSARPPTGPRTGPRPSGEVPVVPVSAPATVVNGANGTGPAPATAGPVRPGDRGPASVPPPAS
jgi:signal transduction histidine kinase